MICPRCGTDTLDASYLCATCGNRSRLAQPEWPARPRPPLPWEDDAPTAPSDPWVRRRRSRNLRDTIVSSVLVALFVAGSTALVLGRRGPSGGDASAVPQPAPMASRPLACLDETRFDDLVDRYRIAEAIEEGSRDGDDPERWARAIRSIAEVLSDMSRFTATVNPRASELFAHAAGIAATDAERIAIGGGYERRFVLDDLKAAGALLRDARRC
ncbi:MAG: hypothetical protein ACKO8G_06435 [Actinomycetota bacterium]